MRNSIVLALSLAPVAWPQSDLFESKIRPILATRCYSCHSVAKQSSGLAVDSKSSLERGGARGPAILSNDPANSLLLKAISYTDPALQMPPDGKLSDAVIADFNTWIRQGTVDPRTTSTTAPADIDWDRARKHWAFQPLPRPAQNQSIDAMIDARLQQAGLQPALLADRPTLLRRITFDLTGLPPSPAQLQAFLVRFAETNGHEFDFYKDEAWRHRDYVIRAFLRPKSGAKAGLLEG